MGDIVGCCTLCYCLHGVGDGLGSSQSNLLICRHGQSGPILVLHGVYYVELFQSISVRLISSNVQL